MDSRIHKLADVQSLNIGSNTHIWQFCVVLKDAKIGENCNINCNVFIENDVVIGNNVTIKPGAQIWDGLTIEDNVFIGPNVTFTNDRVPRSKSISWKLERTIIRQGASIGANATILSGLEIGKFALIGAGSVITKSIKPYTVWYGNPSRHKGFITETGTLLELDLTDKITGEKYILENDKPIKGND